MIFATYQAGPEKMPQRNPHAQHQAKKIQYLKQKYPPSDHTWAYEISQNLKKHEHENKK